MEVIHLDDGTRSENVKNNWYSPSLPIKNDELSQSKADVLNFEQSSKLAPKLYEDPFDMKIPKCNQQNKKRDGDVERPQVKLYEDPIDLTQNKPIPIYGTIDKSQKNNGISEAVIETNATQLSRNKEAPLNGKGDFIDSATTKPNNHADIFQQKTGLSTNKRMFSEYEYLEDMVWGSVMLLYGLKEVL